VRHLQKGGLRGDHRLGAETVMARANEGAPLPDPGMVRVPDRVMGSWAGRHALREREATGGAGAREVGSTRRQAAQRGTYRALQLWTEVRRFDHARADSIQSTCPELGDRVGQCTHEARPEGEPGRVKLAHKLVRDTLREIIAVVMHVAQGRHLVFGSTVCASVQSRSYEIMDVWRLALC
jgi:hypothetical protein